MQTRKRRKYSEKPKTTKYKAYQRGLVKSIIPVFIMLLLFFLFCSCESNETETILFYSNITECLNSISSNISYYDKKNKASSCFNYFYENIKANYSNRIISRHEYKLDMFLLRGIYKHKITMLREERRIVRAKSKYQFKLNRLKINNKKTKEAIKKLKEEIKKIN